ncbi:MAG: flagellar biosynthesis anti-sigma factor FlgM [Nitrospiraceae bacterium]|nr:flagellar biosynthesis anti-sigma factor FlgM [Nitrospiraceae bacterium]
MKIYNNKPASNQEVAGIGKTDKPAPQEKASAAQSASDKIKISSRGREISEMMDAISKLPPTRDDRVNALKEMVSSGKYSPDSLKIAEKLIGEL